MGEDEEDHVSSVSKHSSVKGNISRPHPQRSSRNGRNQNLPPRPRPRNQPRSAQQRQHGEAATMSSAPIGSPSSLNPAAPVFVPQRAVTVESKLPESSTGDRSSRIGHRSGRKGRSHKEANEKENTKNSKADTTQGNIERPQRRKKTGASGSHIHPTIVKESDDLMLRLTEALANGEYDCSICTDTVNTLRSSAYYRFNDGNRCGHVKSAGPSFTDPVLENGHHTLWGKARYGDVQDVNHQVISCQMNIDVGVGR